MWSPTRVLMCLIAGLCLILWKMHEWFSLTSALVLWMTIFGLSSWKMAFCYSSFVALSSSRRVSPSGCRWASSSRSYVRWCSRGWYSATMVHLLSFQNSQHHHPTLRFSTSWGPATVAHQMIRTATHQQARKEPERQTSATDFLISPRFP